MAPTKCDCGRINSCNISMEGAGYICEREFALMFFDPGCFFDPEMVNLNLAKNKAQCA